MHKTGKPKNMFENEMAGFEIEGLLGKAIGLKITSIGKPTIDRAVQRRMRDLALDDQGTYFEILKSSAVELRHLIEEVVIPETWFFRDREPFRAMTQYLKSNWAPKHGNSIFKVLSVPCSTGEEPYSIAMSILGSGWPPEKFSVHAVDISHRCITRAKKGIYAESSFRGSDLVYRSQYFQKRPKHYILKDSVREKVHFHTGNILNKAFMKGLGFFDVIFFRNVLIYFDTHSRKQAIDTLCEILNNDGMVIVGHAEANLLSSFPFVPAPFQQAFAFYRKPKQILNVERKSKKTVTSPPFKQKTTFTKQHFSAPQKSKNEIPDLGLAHSLANKGELKKARIICQEYLDRYGPSAQAFFLLGIIHEAANDADQAEKLFRKALYLEPNHEEALIFLSLLTQKTDDDTESKILEKRIARVQGEKATLQHNDQSHAAVEPNKKLLNDNADN
jgi:chemotaxis protein methyltransferase WspC